MRRYRAKREKSDKRLMRVCRSLGFAISHANVFGLLLRAKFTVTVEQV